MPPDKPRGRQAQAASRVNSTPAGASTIVARADDVNRVVLVRLIELHCRGYLSRAEIEREYGTPYAALIAVARMVADAA